MLNKFQWLIQGINLYLDNSAKYLQPIALQIRTPVWLLVSLFIILVTSYTASEFCGYHSVVWSVSTIGTAIVLLWFGIRVVFKYSPDA